MKNTEWCERLGCYISTYKLRGFDIVKFHDKGMVTYWWVYMPFTHGGKFLFQTDNYDTVREYTKEHQKELTA